MFDVPLEDRLEFLVAGSGNSMARILTFPRNFLGVISTKRPLKFCHKTTANLSSVTFGEEASRVWVKWHAVEGKGEDCDDAVQHEGNNQASQGQILALV